MPTNLRAETKAIDQILDETLMTSRQLKHWEWMAQYYSAP